MVSFVANEFFLFFSNAFPSCFSFLLPVLARTSVIRSGNGDYILCEFGKIGLCAVSVFLGFRCKTICQLISLLKTLRLSVSSWVSFVVLCVPGHCVL